MRKIFFLFILTLSFCSKSATGQIRNHNTVDTFFYFAKYNYYLNTNSVDTSLLYLKVDSKLSDVERLQYAHDNIGYEYAKFKIEKRQQRILIQLFDEQKKYVKDEVYRYSNIVAIKRDSLFFNLAGEVKILIWKAIIPNQ